MRPRARIARELRNVAAELSTQLGLVDETTRAPTAGRFSLLGKVNRARAS